MLNTALGKTGAFGKMGQFGLHTRTQTRLQAPFFVADRAKMASSLRLKGTMLGAAAGHLASQPSLSQRATAANPGLMAPKTPHVPRFTPPPRPGMGLGMARLPHSGPLGIHGGLAGLMGPQMHTGSPGGLNTASLIKTSDLTPEDDEEAPTGVSTGPGAGDVAMPPQALTQGPPPNSGSGGDEDRGGGGA